MKIIVLGGSPKGVTSVTMQYVEYLKKRYPDIEFDIRQPAFEVRKLENSREAFAVLMNGVRDADGILWAFPLYIHSVCGQYLRFIELIGERDAADAFAGKPAATLSTSIHFFDHTAHDVMRAVCEDLGLAFVDSHSAYMDDLTKPEGRRSLEGFFSVFHSAIKEGFPFHRQFPPLPEGQWTSSTVDSPAAKSPSVGSVPRTKAASDAGRRITVVADTMEGRLGAMVSRFYEGFEDSVTVIDLQKVKIAGGCLGCLHCGPNNRCAYDGKDDVRRIYEESIENADLFVMAATIRGRWYSSRLKTFVDRGFFHTHQPFLEGKQTAVLLEGSLTANPGLREGIIGYMEWQGASLNGIIASEGEDLASLDGQVDALARNCKQALRNNYRRPASFLGVGGIKVFRDDIYTHLRMVFQADHREYQKRGIYKTFPHKRPLRLWMYRIVGFITSLPPIRKKMVENMREFMIMPYRGALAKAETLGGKSESAVGKNSIV